MKYGRLINSKKIGKNKNVLVNYGSNAQVEAIDLLFERMGILNEDIIDIEIYELPTYDGEYLVLPVNMCLWTCEENYYFPASDKILPVFLGVHFRIPPISKNAIDYLKSHGPVGCRDRATYRMLKDLDIPSYVNGCLSITLPKRRRAGHKVMFVDIPESLKSFIPQHILDTAENLSQTEILEGMVNHREFANMSKEWYRRIADEASLVVTSRLHCASPCIAMGIPVIITVNEISSRFEWIDSFVPIYTPENFQEIDWNPKELEIEEHKEQVILNALQRIKNVYDKNVFKCRISEFYENGKTNLTYSVMGKISSALGKSQKTKYIIWGSEGFLAEELYCLLSKFYPDIILAGVIDQFSTKEFHGFIPTKDYASVIDDESFVFVTPVSSWGEISKQLNGIGLIAFEDYFGFDFIN